MPKFRLPTSRLLPLVFCMLISGLAMQASAQSEPSEASEQASASSTNASDSASNQSLAQPPAQSTDASEQNAEPNQATEIREGKIEGPFRHESAIFPGTVRNYWLYVPAQYDSEKPACSIVVQDGLNRAKGWKMPEVFDQLIASGEMPVTIGIFVDPGVVPAVGEKGQPRFNRSFEYDSLGDNYARFLLEELIPKVSKTYSLSTNPNDRAIAGASSGGICAFNAAWERPDAFRRVFSTIGTFVGLRGANEFPVLVRKFEPKPIRVYLQDGSNDLNIYAGDWWVANQDMLSALQWAGYDVNYAWGDGGHDGEHGQAILADAMRWLWRDYPAPVNVQWQPEGKRRVDLLSPENDWQMLSSGHELADSPTCNALGELFFCDSKAGRIYRVGKDNKTRVFKDQVGRISSLAFTPNDTLLAVKDGKQVVKFDMEGTEAVLLPDVRAQHIFTMPNGFYLTQDTAPSVQWSSYDGKVVESLVTTEPIVSIVPTADHQFAHLATRSQQYTLHAQLGEAGALLNRQRFGYLHTPYMSSASNVSAMVTDVEGNVYAATATGIQVLDQLGRVNIIIRKPAKDAITGLAFGGALQDTLYVTAGEAVYSRKIRAKGVASFAEPVELPRPGL